MGEYKIEEKGGEKHLIDANFGDDLGRLEKDSLGHYHVNDAGVRYDLEDTSSLSEHKGTSYKVEIDYFFGSEKGKMTYDRNRHAYEYEEDKPESKETTGSTYGGGYGGSGYGVSDEPKWFGLVWFPAIIFLGPTALVCFAMGIFGNGLYGLGKWVWIGAGIVLPLALVIAAYLESWFPAVAVIIEDISIFVKAVNSTTPDFGRFIVVSSYILFIIIVAFDIVFRAFKTFRN